MEVQFSMAHAVSLPRRIPLPVATCSAIHAKRSVHKTGSARAGGGGLGRLWGLYFHVVCCQATVVTTSTKHFCLALDKLRGMSPKSPMSTRDANRIPRNFRSFQRSNHNGETSWATLLFRMLAGGKDHGSFLFSVVVFGAEFRRSNDA